VSCFGRIECCCAVKCTVQRVWLGMLDSVQLICKFQREELGVIDSVLLSVVFKR